MHTIYSVDFSRKFEESLRADENVKQSSQFQSSIERGIIGNTKGKQPSETKRSKATPQQ